MWKPCRPKCPIEAAGGGAKNSSERALRTPEAQTAFRFPANLRYFCIPSRFFPAIPTCRGYLTRPILTLDGRGRLGLALKSSARGYRSPPGSPKRGLGRAPRCTPARGISLFASGEAPNEVPANRPGGSGCRQYGWG